MAARMAERWYTRLSATDHVIGHELVHAFQFDVTNTNAQ
jgi:hypothetical protein